MPSQVVGELVGIPPEDWDQIRDWAEQSTSGQDPELAGDSSYRNASSGMTDMAIYAIQFAQRRRQEEPREDLASLILAGDFGDGPMTDVEFGSFFVQLVTAGNDTTKTMLSSGLQALLAHPEQLAELRADRSLIPGAVEEILRWANPLHYFRRTCLVDTELRGKQITAGDKVAMIYTSANRDEDVFGRRAGLRHPPLAEPAPLVRHRRCTSASASTSPDSKGGCSSTSCSTRSRRSSRPGRHGAFAPTSTTGSSTSRSTSLADVVPPSAGRSTRLARSAR